MTANANGFFFCDRALIKHGILVKDS